MVFLDSSKLVIISLLCSVIGLGSVYLELYHLSLILISTTIVLFFLVFYRLGNERDNILREKYK